MNPEQKANIREDDSKPLEVEGGNRVVGETVLEIDHLRVDEESKDSEKPLKIGEEWGVIEGPLAGLVRVPLRQRERLG